MTLKNLLVPTDFSDAAHNSLTYALAFAKDIQAKVYVLSSYYVPINTIETDYVADQAIWLEQARDRAYEEMQLLEENHLKKSGVAYQTMVHPGPATSDINETIKENGIDLVVMSSQDEGGIENFFVNLYTHTIRHAKAPVLLIPEDTTYQRPRKLVLATDLKPFENSEPVESLGKIASFLQAEVLLVHVHKADDQMNDKKEKELQRLQTQLAELKPGVVFQQAEDTEAGIFGVMHQERAQWLLAISHQYGLLEGLFHSSLTKKLARDSIFPLLVSHE